jgi:hypothetical protein
MANDDISDLGAMTAASPWIYNQVGANLTGILVVLVGFGLWRALSPDIIGRIGAAVLVAEGISTFFDGIFHLDCRGIDAACDNVSWHSRATRSSPDSLRRSRSWRRSFSRSHSAGTPPGATRGSQAFSPCLPSSLRTLCSLRSVTVLPRAMAPWSIFAWIAFISVRLLQKDETAAEAAP